MNKPNTIGYKNAAKGLAAFAILAIIFRLAMGYISAPVTAAIAIAPMIMMLLITSREAYAEGSRDGSNE